VYGDGFRAAKAGYDRCGRDLARFLERVRRDGKLP
jgi:CubicO group peptidase (beta-lactamase class C family)